MSRCPSEFRLRVTELRSAVVPAPVRFFGSIGSTNRWAADALRRGRIVAPTLVVASTQSAGVGRRGARWWSPRGNLSLTLALPPADREAVAAHELPIRSAVAVVRAVDRATAGRAAVGLKWPNDVVVPCGKPLAGRKIAGLLCERLACGDLIGVGLNVNVDQPATFRNAGRPIASLARLIGGRVDLTTVACAVSDALLSALTTQPLEPFTAVLDEYRSRDALLGTPVEVTAADGRILCGVSNGLDPHGRLILRADKQLRIVAVGHVGRWGPRLKPPRARRQASNG